MRNIIHRNTFVSDRRNYGSPFSTPPALHVVQVIEGGAFQEQTH